MSCAAPPASSPSECTSPRDEIETLKSESGCDGEVVVEKYDLSATVPWKDSSDERSRNECESGVSR